jgi:hypothetical protein
VTHDDTDDPPRTKPPPRLPIEAVREVETYRFSTALMARQLYPAAHKFALLDARPVAEHEGWSFAYDQMLQWASTLQYIVKRPANPHERELLAWSKLITPSRFQIATTQWERLEGLSAGFVWQQALFEAALFRLAKTWLPYSWVTTNGWHDVLCEHQGIERDYGNATWRLHRLCDEMVWHAVPVTVADRLLIRRAHLVRALGDRVFHLKYRRAVRKWERDRGDHLPERKLRKPVRFTRPGIPRVEGDWNLPVKLTLRYLRSDD